MARDVQSSARLAWPVFLAGIHPPSW